MANIDDINTTISKNGAALDHGVDQAGAAAHNTINKISDAARPAVERFTAGAHQAVEKLMSVANATADTVSQKSEQLMDAQERLVEDCRVYVRQKPVTSVAIAVGIGYLLSRLMGSKRS
jgi:ElaB/YqjD/DUF883 family membrane-anchored ribosome-binding protein